MHKFGKESAAPPGRGVDRLKGGNEWAKSHWCILALGIIVIVAFLLRFVFAYGVSADGGYALSGGSGAQYHLHVVESILNGTYSMSDPTVNYPVGGVLYNPPLMDYLAAAVAMIVGGETVQAASFGLAVLNPIFGALACIPVFLVGKELYGKVTGTVAALIFAFLALPISTSVFSSGNEYALASFLVAFMVYFAVKMTKVADSDNPSRKSILTYGALTGIFLMLAALTWNGFRIAVVLLAVAMVLQAVSGRIRGKDFADLAFGYAFAILLGVLVPAAYYVPAGLVDAVYSGPLMIGVISVALVVALVFLRQKPWVITVPALAGVFVIFCVILYLVAPDLCGDLISGNSPYSNSVMSELVSDRVSLSAVAAYYGWLTVWLPACLVIYEVYRYFREEMTATKLFTVLWLFVFFVETWSTYANAAVIGCVYGVGSAAAIVLVVRQAKVGEWAKGIGSAGYPNCFRKIAKPFPLISVLVVALLVVVPNLSFAVDAGQPSNTENEDSYYAGNTSFTIKTGDDYPFEQIWETYKDAPKSGAIATWLDYTYDAITQAGFDNVSDSLGNGATAVANMYLSEGSAGATAAMILRLILSDPDTDYSACFSTQSVYQKLSGYISDPASALSEIESDPDTYGDVRSNLNDESAVYLAGIECILSGMGLTEIMQTYDKICARNGNTISYLLMDGTMLPLYYGDGGYFPTIAYFAGYSTDSYGAPTQFYSYNTYYGYTTYTSEIYETFLWRALIGLSASDAGYSSSYSYISALSASDGTVKAIPGYGLAGYTVAQWLVYYCPDTEDEDAEWTYMDGWEAQALQKEQGGTINYLAAIVLLEYTGLTGSTVDVSISDSDGTPISGASVSVYEYSEVYEQYVLFAKTLSMSGLCTVPIPSSSDYYAEVAMGDVVLNTYVAGEIPSSVTVKKSTAEGEVRVNDELYDRQEMLLELDSDSDSVSVPVEGGKFSLDVLPGSYSYTLYGADGSSLGTGTIDLYPGEMTGVIVSPSSYTITVSVEDIFGKSVNGSDYDTVPMVYATDTSTGLRVASEVSEEGEAVLSVIPGTYTLSMGGGLVSITSTTQTVSSSNKTTTITAYESTEIEVTGVPDGTVLTISAGEFSTVAVAEGGAAVFELPVGLATDNVSYSVYGVSGETMYCGVYDGKSTATMKSYAYGKISGQLMDGDDGESGVVTFMFDSLSGFQIKYSTDSEGCFQAIVPVGVQTVYATNEDDLVYFGSLSVASSGVDELKIDLVDGRKVTQYFRYDDGTSAGNANLPFVLVTIEFTYGEADYLLYSMTNTSGVAYFYIPDNVSATVHVNGTGELDNEYFYCSDIDVSVSSGTSSASDTLIVRWYGYGMEEDEEYDPDNYVKRIEFTAEFDFTYTYYEDEIEVSVKKGDTVMLCPGQYTIKMDDFDGLYFEGTVYLYPGDEGLTGFNPVEVVKVNVTKGESDKITINSDGGNSYSFDGGYYLKKGYEYYLISEGDDSVRYAYLDFTGNPENEMDLDMTSSESMTVTGFVGIVANGTLTVEYEQSGSTVRAEFDIADGVFSMLLPSDVTTVVATASVSNTVDGAEYLFEATVELSDLVDGAVRNISVLSTESEPEDEDSDFDAVLEDAKFADGKAEVTVTITNNTDGDMTYLIVAGSAWKTDEATSVTVSAGESKTVTVTGTYDQRTVAPGHDGVSISVTDVNGGSTVTVEIEENSAPNVGSSGSDILKAGDEDAANDRAYGSEYLYAVTVVNDDVYSKQVIIDGTVPEGWYATVMDSDGKYVGKLGEPVTVYGLRTSTYYVALMQISLNPEEKAETVPEMDITVTVGSDVKELSLTPTEIDVETSDGTVSGGNAVLERSDVPAGIWFLAVIIILLAIAIGWMAGKRGVFSRRRL